MQNGNSQSRLVEAMMRPEFYPEAPARVELRQTHMSYVFMAGDYVYKVKKPVHFDFADAFTLGARYLLCRQEMRLNRRLAPEVYVSVLPIIDEGKGFVLGQPDDIYHARVVEYVVKMRRLPEDRMLDHLLRAGGVSPAAVADIARKLVKFHRDASLACGWRFGSSTAIERSVLENFESCRRFVGYTIGLPEFDEIGHYLSNFVRSHRDLFNERAREGRVREGHGDLRCEHICLNPALDIYDCVEFDERLRYADVASEMAFLAMDFDAFGAPHLADELIAAYAKLADDPGLASLVNFYKCHRACIRGKVDSLKSLETEVPAAERDAAIRKARAKFALAHTYAQRGRPSLVVVCGLVGSGKTTVAEIIRRLTGFEVFNSDRIRKRLAGIPESHRPGAEYGGGIYGPGFDRLTYDAMIDSAQRSLSDGRGAVLDATFKSVAHRRAALELGDRMRVPVLFVECQVEEKEALRRLQNRAMEGTGPSDATVDVYAHQKLEYAPIREIPPSHYVVLDTTSSENLVQRLERALALQFESEGVRSSPSPNV